MSSVAYPVQPTEPGWWGTAWLMILGWLTAAVVLGGLYLAGTFLGALGRNEDGGLYSHAPTDRPFVENGTWSLLANLSVLLLALIVTTVAVAWQLRERFAMVSEGRLGLVLLLTGGVPYLTTGKSAPFFFLIAVWAVRAWVVRDELRFPRRLLGAIGVALVLAIASYGLPHPVWVESASAVTSFPPSKRPVVLLVLHNASRGTIEIERVTGGLVFSDGRAGFPGERGSGAPVRIPAGRSGTFTLEMRGGACGTAILGAVRYRVFGLTLHEPLRVTPSGLPGCS